MNKSLSLLLVTMLGMSTILLASCKKEDPKHEGFRCYSSTQAKGAYFIGTAYDGSTCNSANGFVKVSTMPTTNLVGNGGCQAYKGTTQDVIVYLYFGNSYSYDNSNYLTKCATDGGEWNYSTKVGNYINLNNPGLNQQNINSIIQSIIIK